MPTQAGPEPLIWLDMEMTGLEPDVCVPLQVAIVVTTKDLEEVAAQEWTIWQPESRLETMSPFVRRMHTENGLLEQVRSSRNSVLDVERQMIAMLLAHCRPPTAEGKPGEGVLAGNSIHQDRRFLEVYFPVFSGLLNYRMVDVSTLKELVRRWLGPEGSFSKGASQHTALSDARESVAELRHYRKILTKQG